MNDGKIIIDKIMQEADAAAQAVLDRGQKEADEILRQAQDRADRLADRYTRDAETEADKAYAKEISGAEMKAKKAVLNEKQNILAEVIAEAEQKLLALDDKEYAEVIGGMLERLDPAYGKEIIVSEKDRDRLKAVIAEKGYTLSEKSSDIGGGFIVKNGDIEYNYSFESIITVEKEEIQQIAAKILF